MKNPIDTKFIIIVTAIPFLGLTALLGLPIAIFFFSFPVIFTLLIIVFIYNQYKALSGIPNIQSPDRKIAVVNGFLLKSTLLLVKDVKRKMLLMLATAYADKGDYIAAFETCQKAWELMPKSFSQKTSLKGEEAMIYTEEIEILLHLGRTKAAESLLKELLVRTFSDSSGFFLSKLAQIYFSVYTGDACFTRELLGQAWSFLSDRAIQEEFPMKDFKHALYFLEAKTDMLEKKYNEAYALFTNTVHGSRCYRLTRLSREELDYWTTRS